ncbi:MAG: site-2 protease family protein [Myxococcota bacterium]
MSEPAPDDKPTSEPEPEAPRSKAREWLLPLALMGLTFVSMMWTAAFAEHQWDAHNHLEDGLPFATALMTILFAHEMGHYIAALLHKVDVSPPYFIPMPFFMLGTLGAVIAMRGEIRSRNALLDVGAAGPLAGLAVALPILCYGIATSPIDPLPPRDEVELILEGHSILYELLLYAFHGPIAEGHDITLSQIAFAGWAGLVVTMINLIPHGQLDGGHIAYALVGPKQDRYGEVVLRALPVIAFLSSGYYVLQAFLDQAPWSVIKDEALAGAPWLFWFVLLNFMGRFSGMEHPPTEDATLSPVRRIVAIGTLAVFVLLFMPSWGRAY